MLSARYDNDQERGQALSHAMSGLSVGIMLGPVYGGLMYQYAGKIATFLVLAALALVDGRESFISIEPQSKYFLLVLRLAVITPKSIGSPSSTNVTFWTIARDPRILTAVGKRA